MLTIRYMWVRLGPLVEILSVNNPDKGPIHK